MENNNNKTRKFWKSNKSFTGAYNHRSNQPLKSDDSFIYHEVDGWRSLATKVKLFIRIIYVWQSVRGNIFFTMAVVAVVVAATENCISNFEVLLIEIIGTRARMIHALRLCVCVHVEKLLLLTQSCHILSSAAESMLLLLLSTLSSPASHRLFCPLSQPPPSSQLSYPPFSLYCKVVFPCVTFSQVLMNHPIIGAKYFSWKLCTTDMLFTAEREFNVRVQCYMEKHSINFS